MDRARSEETSVDEKPVKRQKGLSDERKMQNHHPHGVEPMGNFYSAEAIAYDRKLLGLLGPLSDGSILEIASELDARGLSMLAATSRGSYVFAMHEDLWRTLTLSDLQGRFHFQGTWKTTYLASHPSSKHLLRCTSRAITVKGFYSDLLFMPWMYASMGIDSSWLEVENIDRRSGLSLEAFVEEYERPNRPVIITDVVPKWKVYRQKQACAHLHAVFAGRQACASCLQAYTSWSVEALQERCGNTDFSVGGWVC